MDVNEAWKKTCKIVLGGEIGGLEDYAAYLRHYLEPIQHDKSSISGKQIYFAEQDFCPQAKFISFDETAEYQKKFGSPPVNAEKFSGLGAICEAVMPKAYYSGNIILGNSGQCENCDRCSDVFFAKESHSISESKYCAYSSLLRISENCFGTSMEGAASYLIRCSFGYKAVRCFECLRMMDSADCYFSSSLENCHDCIFCFNLQNKSHCVGNLQLTKEEYAAFKQKFLAEVREKLKRDRKLSGVADLISKGRGAASQKIGRGVRESPHYGRDSKVSQKIEEAFGKTTRLLVGRELRGIDDYEKWLFRHVRAPPRLKSVVSGKALYNMPVQGFAYVANCCATLEESYELGKKSIAKEDLPQLTLESAPAVLDKIRYTTPENKFGENHDMEDATNYSGSISCARGSVYWTSKYCCYNFWIRDGEYVFGSDLVFYSKFCLKCYSSNRLTRCFEVSESLSCSDCYFCHNCENVRDSMFCFNAKNLSYAIGNVQLQKEQYLRLKKIVLEEIAGKLEKEKQLDLSIYNVGCKK